jgi:hypothetical protein
VQPKAPRFRREFDRSIEEIRIPARRNWFALLFLPIWLTGWFLGELSAVRELASQFSLFLAVWLCGWTLGGLFALATLAWQLRGVEYLRVVGGDLEIGYRSFGFNKSWLYHGSEIRDLAAAPGVGFFERFSGWDNPVWTARRWGAVKFRYGSRMIHAASALDEAEGQEVVAFLASRLPASATALRS